MADRRVPSPLSLIRLGAEATIAEADGWIHGLPGHRFGAFGRALGVRAMTQGELVEGASLVLTPVNSVRYWEFDFVDRVLQQAGGVALDVSSPRLLSFYLAHRARFDRIDMANPDAKDLRVTGDLARGSGLSRVNCLEADALEASRGQPRYSAVWSISVVEHIPGDRGDSDAVRAMFDSLLPGGVLVITVPVDREAWDEYRTTDTYSLGASGGDGRYFFQRFYDAGTLADRIIGPIGVPPQRVDWFGERTRGTFAAYVERWLDRGFAETVSDPSFVARNFRPFSSYQEMPGMGVCGLAFQAPRVEGRSASEERET